MAGQVVRVAQSPVDGLFAQADGQCDLALRSVVEGRWVAAQETLDHHLVVGGLSTWHVLGNLRYAGRTSRQNGFDDDGCLLGQAVLIKQMLEKCRSFAKLVHRASLFLACSVFVTQHFTRNWRLVHSQPAPMSELMSGHQASFLTMT